MAPRADLAGRVVCVGDVVDADEKDGGFGFQAIEVAVVQAPEDMLGVVAADAEVEGMAGRVIFRPDLFAIALPALSDGVSDEDDFRLALVLLGAPVEFEEPLVCLAVAGDRLDALVELRGWFGLAESGGGEQDEGGGEGCANGDDSIHAWSLGLPGALFKQSQFESVGRTRWSAAMPPRSSRMSTTRSWPW
jgi:hypothetical protein